MADLAGLARIRLLQWMEANPKVTQVQIGRALGLTQAWVSKYKAGNQEADIDQLSTMARVFGHTLMELVDMRPDPKEQALLDEFRKIEPARRDFAIEVVKQLAGSPQKRGRSR